MVVLLIIFSMVFLAVISTGCIKLMQQSAGSTMQTEEILHPDPTYSVATPDSEIADTNNPPARPAVSGTVTTYGIVSDASPILTPDPYPIPQAVRINETPETSRHLRYADFTRKYVLRANATGLVVNATRLKGPLWINFDVEPLYDCLENPESCRGETAKTISRPYFTLTVRNNQTGEIVAEDGYGYEYSSQKTNRTVKIYGEGWYHITLTGNSVDVTLSVATGMTPAATGQQSSAGQQSSDRTLSPEYRRYLEEFGDEP